jgi:potassium efflux system protein
LDIFDDFLGVTLFSIGDTDTTIGALLAAIAVAIATLWLGRVARNAVTHLAGRLKEHSAGPSPYGIALEVIVWVIGLELALHILGIRLATLFATTGFLALGAGFAVKNIVENFLSGGILRAEKTISPGDLIIVNGKWLIVNEIRMRATVAYTYDGDEVLIPNTLIAQSMVQNLTRNNRLHRIELQVGVAYKSDLALVRKTLQETIDALEWRSQAKNPVVYLAEFGESSVDYAVDVWIDDANDSRGRRSDLHEAIWWALKEKDITIAFRQLDVHLDPGDIKALS